MLTTHLLPDGEDTGTEVQGVADTMVEVTGELEEGEMDSEADTVVFGGALSKVHSAGELAWYQRRLY